MNAAAHLLGEAALERHGRRTALVCGSESVSYRELAKRMAHVANALRAFGARPGDRVLLLMRDTPDLAATWLGTVYAGAVAVALGTRLSEEEYRHVVADSGACIAIVDDPFVTALRALPVEVLPFRGLVCAPSDSCAEAFPARADDPAFWLYSSGTTGKPKGIVHAHASVLSAGQTMREVLGIGAGQTVLATSKLFFAYALENGLLGPLANGATVIMNPEWPEAEPVLDLVARHQPAAFFSVPTFYRKLLALGAERLAPFRAVRRCIAAGEKLPARIFEMWRRATDREILSAYGMSETFCVCLATEPGHAAAGHSGKPLAGVDTRLVTSEGRVARPGEPGVLWVRHPALALGYANLAERTSVLFRDGWFCSNDVFVQDAQGFLSYQGRADDMLKVAGQWLQPEQIEDAVAADPAIAEAACVPITDMDGFERLALFVAGHGSLEIAARAAASACDERLPRYKRPKWIRAVSELPRTATGKVQRFRLRELIERELHAKQ